MSYFILHGHYVMHTGNFPNLTQLQGQVAEIQCLVSGVGFISVYGFDVSDMFSPSFALPCSLSSSLSVTNYNTSVH